MKDKIKTQEPWEISNPLKPTLFKHHKKSSVLEKNNTLENTHEGDDVSPHNSFK